MKEKKMKTSWGEKKGKRKQKTGSGEMKRKKS